MAFCDPSLYPLVVECSHCFCGYIASRGDDKAIGWLLQIGNGFPDDCAHQLRCNPLLALTLYAPDSLLGDRLHRRFLGVFARVAGGQISAVSDPLYASDIQAIVFSQTTCRLQVYPVPKAICQLTYKILEAVGFQVFEMQWVDGARNSSFFHGEYTSRPVRPRPASASGA